MIQALAPSLIIPVAVSLEIRKGTDHDPAKTWLRSLPGTIRGSPAIPIPSKIIALDLGAGETEVLAHGSCQAGSVCVLDDLAARKCAEVFRIPVMGTLGILLKAKLANLIPRLAPEIDHLVTVGSQLSPVVIQKELALADES